MAGDMAPASVPVIAELLRKLNGGTAFELMAAPALALDAMEGVMTPRSAYAFAHVAAV
jgi:hypothetical protein